MTKIGSGFRVRGSGFGFRVPGSGFGFWVRVLGSGFRVQVQGSVRVQGSLNAEPRTVNRCETRNTETRTMNRSETRNPEPRTLNCLDSDAADSLRGAVMTRGERYYEAAGALIETIRQGGAAFHHAHGRSFLCRRSTSVLEARAIHVVSGMRQEA
jgi:hypothetical protein